MINRVQYAELKANISENKVVLVKGPRRSGKLTVVRQVLDELDVAHLEFDAANKKQRSLFGEVSSAKLQEVFGKVPYIVIEEAQYLENLQELIEEVLSGNLQITLILCCSYEPLMDEVLKEVLQVQGLEISVLPPSFYELAQKNGLPEEERLLEDRLVFGNYPEVTEDLDQAQQTLSNMIREVIFTNLGVTDRINKEDKLFRVLQVLAFHIGEPVSYNEVGEKCGVDNETVERYVDLLERSFILIRIPSYSTEKRYELKKSNVIYFLDNGIRNALINNFNPLILRNDVDQLWRNWLIAERVKWNRMNRREVSYRFWRTHTRQTLDFVEFYEGNAAAYKTSWEKKKKMKFPVLFTEYYPQISTHTLNRSTYWSFLTKK